MTARNQPPTRVRIVPALLAASIAWCVLMELVVFHWFTFGEDAQPISGASSSSFGVASIASSDRGLMTANHQFSPSVRGHAGGEGATIKKAQKPSLDTMSNQASAQRNLPQPKAKRKAPFKVFELEGDANKDDDAAAADDDNEDAESARHAGHRKKNDLNTGESDDVGTGDDGQEASADEEEEGAELKDEAPDDESKTLEADDDPIGGGEFEAAAAHAALRGEMKHDLMRHEGSSSLDAEEGSLMVDKQDDASIGGRDRGRPSHAEKGKWPQFNLNWTMFASRNNSNSTFPVGQGSDQVVSILILPQMPEKQRKANSRHLIYDGIQQSRYLNFTDNVNDTSANVVWVFDLLAGREEWAPLEDETLWCPVLSALIRDVQKVRLARGQPVVWPLAIVDNRDFPIISTCPEIGDALGDENVRYSYRSAVKQRTWNASIPWVHSGKLLDRESFPQPMLYEYRQRPIGVRTDTVKAVEGLLEESYGLKLCHPIEELNRTIDVSYFWDLVNYTRRDSHLRDLVYRILKNMERDRPDLNMMLGVRGQTAIAGRRKVSNVYVDTLLQSKIVVVTQRDHWEDQYRLFEAIVSGAMVMTDKMLSLPRGLKDGESVVEYTGNDDLRNKLNYYLTHRDERVAIAKRGRYVAMSNHRSWLHMEEIVFGSPVSVCSSATGSACPYIVHAHQVNEDC